jgi:hypothetical protein
MFEDATILNDTKYIEVDKIRVPTLGFTIPRPPVYADSTAPASITLS